MRTIAFLLACSLPAIAFAQVAPVAPGQSTVYGGSRLGYASGASINRGPTAAPTQQPTYTPPPTRTPGSSVGYVSGAYVPGANSYSPGAGSSSGGYVPSAVPMAPNGGVNPTAGLSAGAFTAPVGGGTTTYAPALQFTGLTTPAVTPSAPVVIGGTPGVASPVAASNNEAYTSAIASFNKGQYAETLKLLDSPAHALSAPLPTRKLYVAALVGDGQLSLAAYEAIGAAKSNPAAFFTEKSLSDTYKNNPDLKQHYKAIAAYANNNAGDLDPLIIQAMYGQLMLDTKTQPQGTDAVKPPATVLNGLKDVDATDKAWVDQLKAAAIPAQ